MNGERLNQIEEIYHAALKIAPGERESFLLKRCGADEDLRREVESLLSFENISDNLLDGSPESFAAEMFSEKPKQTDLKDQKIGHYKIIRLLGRGGMGSVYLAEDTRLDRRAAIKFLSDEFVHDADKLNRFQREAKSASALNHPNILTVYEIGESRGLHYIATEFIDGKVLGRGGEEAVANKNSLGEILDVSIQVVSALRAAHEAGIIHRDIKPDNIMLRKDSIVKVLDFGLAKLFQREEERENETLPVRSSSHLVSASLHTNPGIIMGTPQFMSPEQARGIGVTHQTDIFSFGVMFYEMLSGKMPFDGESTMDIIGAVLYKEPVPIRELFPELPADIESIVNKTLCKDTAGRYQNASDLLNDLRKAKQRVDYEQVENDFLPENAKAEDSSPVRENITADGSMPISKTNKPDTKRTNLPTDEVLELQTQNLTSTVSPAAKISRSENSAKNFRRRFRVGKMAVIAPLIVLLAGMLFFGYRHFATSSQIESVAVMPFVNEGGNADVEYLSDGMTETLIRSLSQIPNLNVKSRSAVFRYKGRDTDVQTIARELNVQAVLNGRVVRRGDQIVLSLELVDARTENVLWSEQYNRSQSDLVLLQSEITSDVSREMKIKFSGQDEAKISKIATTDPDAYQAYLKGRYFWNRRTAENLTKAIEQFKIAADRDPNYALAFAGLADCYVALRDYAAIPMSETASQAKDFAERAIALDDRLAEPHASLGKFYSQMRRQAEAEREFKKAIELNPNYATAYHWYSLMLRDLGRYDESFAMIKRAHELDPLSSVISINVSQVYQAHKNWNASVENTLKVIELDPTYSGAYNNLALAYIKLGRISDAVENFEKAVALSNRADVTLRNLGYGYGIAGRRDEALAVAHQLEERFAQKKSLGIYVATVYAGLGDKDKVFEWLEKDLDNGDSIAAIRWSPQFELIADDPRYQNLLDRMNTPE